MMDALILCPRQLLQAKTENSYDDKGRAILLLRNSAIIIFIKIANWEIKIIFSPKTQVI